MSPTVILLISIAVLLCISKMCSGKVSSANKERDSLKAKLTEFSDEIADKNTTIAELRIFNDGFPLFEKYLKNGGTDSDYDEWVSLIAKKHSERINSLKDANDGEIRQLENRLKTVVGELEEASACLSAAKKETKNSKSKAKETADEILANAKAKANEVYQKAEAKAEKIIDDAQGSVTNLPSSDYAVIAKELQDIVKEADTYNSHQASWNTMVSLMKIYVKGLKNKETLFRENQ
jgi:cell division septum initiation protein DivIVA